MGVAQKVARGAARESVWIYDQAARNALASAIARIDGLAEQVHDDDWAYVKAMADDLWAAFWMGRKDGV